MRHFPKLLVSSFAIVAVGASIALAQAPTVPSVPALKFTFLDVGDKYVADLKIVDAGKTVTVRVRCSSNGTNCQTQVLAADAK